MIVGGFPAQRGHQDKDIAFDDKGNVYVTVGLPSNACADPDRQPGAKGHGSRARSSKGRRRVEVQRRHAGQTYATKNRYATGLRQGVAIAWHDGHLYLAMNSRDSLDTLYPDNSRRRTTRTVRSSRCCRWTKATSSAGPTASTTA